MKTIHWLGIGSVVAIAALAGIIFLSSAEVDEADPSPTPVPAPQWTGSAKCAVKLPDGTDDTFSASCGAKGTYDDAANTLKIDLELQITAKGATRTGEVIFNIFKSTN